MLRIVASQGTKLCSYFNCHSLYNILKDKRYRISGSEIYECLLGPEKCSGLSRKRATGRRFVFSLNLPLVSENPEVELFGGQYGRHEFAYRALSPRLISALFCLNSRQAGHRVGEHLQRIMPMIVQYSKVENDDELREYCIQVQRGFC